MLISLTTDSFPSEYVPTVSKFKKCIYIFILFRFDLFIIEVFDNYSYPLVVDGIQVSVGLWGNFKLN
jgi:hypothetical protein